MKMSEFSDNVVEYFSGIKRNHVVSTIAGTLFALGWWFLIDAAILFPGNEEFNHVFHICGVISTVGFIMLNTVSNAAVRGDSDYDGCCANVGPKIWFFIGCTLLFASLIVSSYILFGLYITKGLNPMWPGLAVFLQNILIVVGGLVFRFGRIEE